MKAKIPIALVIFTLAAFSNALAGFRILRCTYKNTSNSTQVTLLFDSQFPEDVMSRLKEGINYILYIDAKTKSQKFSVRFTFSYDVINSLYTVKGKKEERFKKKESFINEIKELKLTLPGVPEKIRARRVNPYLSFPFNLIPDLGTYKTRWIDCHEAK